MNYVNIDLDNGLSPEQRQASIQSRAETSITFQNIWCCKYGENRYYERCANK